MKRQIALGDEVRLAGDPPELTVGMRGHGDDGRIVGLVSHRAHVGSFSPHAAALRVVGEQRT